MAEVQETRRNEQNRLLDALPPGELERLRPHLEAVRLEQREPVYEAGTPIEHVYFPTGVFSVTTMRDGSVIEVGTVGNEGMLGLQAFLDGTIMPVAAFSQVAGDSLRMDTDAFKRERWGLAVGCMPSCRATPWRCSSSRRRRPPATRRTRSGSDAPGGCC